MTTARICPLCRSEHTTLAQLTHQEGTQTYTAYSCESCTLMWWEPFKNPGAEWYGHDERYADRNAHAIFTPNEKHIGVLDFLKDKKGKVLDVGCGVGNFLAYAQTRGWEGWGIDFDQDAIETARRTFGLSRVSVSDMRTFAQEHKGMTFDLITFFDVFEHLDNHEEFITAARSLLAPRGHLAFSVPYQRAWRWLTPADLPPRHLTRNSERSLDVFFKRHGCSIILLKRIPASLYFIVLKLRFKYGKLFSFGAVRHFSKSEADHKHAPSRPSLQVRMVMTLAKVKDVVLFGIPALIIWILLLPLPGRYTDMYAVATMDS